MKIAFIIGFPVTHTGHGVVSQAMTWKNGLESLGHKVVLADMWTPCDWKEFDVIQIFMYSEYAAEYIEAIAPVNPNIVLAPILDPDFSIMAMRFVSGWGCSKLKLSNRYYRTSQVQHLVRCFFVRSDFEALYVEKGWHVMKDRIFKVPLSFNYCAPFEGNRENFCFHASFLADDRKNVRRLIEAAKKYGFLLKLAGKLRNKEEVSKVNGWIDGARNIEYLGFLSQDNLIEMYKKARVFALPSIYEGVGIVALDAAAMGCDVVLTNRGGPKEYYDGKASLVNPYSIDEIGKSIVKFLEGFTYQPQLQKHVLERYSLDAVVKQLIQGYEIVRRQ